MTTLDTGTYGAKRISFAETTYRDLVAKLMAKDPGASIDDSFAMFLEEIEKPRNRKHLMSALEYAHANAYGALHKPQPRKATPVQAAKAKVEQVALVEQAKQKIKVAAVRMVLLDMVMPNGKALRDSTGKDCAKAGGWLAAIAKKIKPADIVGKVLSEAEVRELLKVAA